MQYFVLNPCCTCVLEDLYWIMQFCKLCCMTWLSESLQTSKLARSLFQAWLEKPGTSPRSRQYPWQHYLHLVTARMKVCPAWGAWKWSLMRALTDDVQGFWGTCDSAEDGPKASPPSLPPPPMFAPNCLVNPSALMEESLTQPSNSRAQSSSSLIADLAL